MVGRLESADAQVEFFARQVAEHQAGRFDGRGLGRVVPVAGPLKSAAGSSMRGV